MYFTGKVNYIMWKSATNKRRNESFVFLLCQFCPDCEQKTIIAVNLSLNFFLRSKPLPKSIQATYLILNQLHKIYPHYTLYQKNIIRSSVKFEKKIIPCI